MYIHRRYCFALDRKDGREAWPLRIRVKWGGRPPRYLNIGVGVSIDPAKWSKEAHRAHANTTHGRGKTPASVINRRIAEVEEAIDAAFTEAERAERVPTPTELRTAVNKALGKAANTADTLTSLYQQYLRQQERERQWTDGTTGQMVAFGHTLERLCPDARPYDLDGRFAVRFVAQLTADGKSNVTAKTNLCLLRCFAAWLDRNGYAIDRSVIAEKPRIKTIRRNVIYLTPDELKRLETADFGAEKHGKRIAEAADILLLSSYTGLRISDVGALKPDNIHAEYIEIRTKKTGAPLRIELNRHSRAAIARLSESPRKGGYIAPDMARTRSASVFMREACRIAGIDSPVSQAYYQGARRVERTGPKWQFISTHTGRRTFICNALSLGIPPQVVMKWTGHSEYASMKPYIDIIDAAKASNMARFDSL